MSIKRKTYFLVILFVIISIASIFIYHFYSKWQETLEHSYYDVIVVNNVLNKTITNLYEQQPSNNQTDEEIKQFINDVIEPYENISTGYYINVTNSFFEYGIPFNNDEYFAFQNSLSSSENQASSKDGQGTFYKGHTLLQFAPLLVNDQEIGFTWTAIKSENFFSFFKDDLIILFEFLLGFLLVAIIFTKLISNTYIKQLRAFKNTIRFSNIVPASVLNFPKELMSIYDEINISRAEIVESERRFRDVITAFEEFVWEIDLDGNLLYLSKRIETMLGFSPTDLIGKNIFELMEEPYNVELATLYKELIRKQATFHNIDHIKKDIHGRPVHLCANGIPIYNEEQKLIGYRGATRNVSEEKKHEQEIQYLAYYDQLTALPNRTMLMKHLQALLELQQPFAILFLDLDQFKNVNDSLSHNAGDQLLKLTSHRLSDVLEEQDKIFRFGGDEFIVTLSNYQDLASLQKRVQKITDTFREPIYIDNVQLFNTVSIGISIYPTHGDSVETLIKRADIAMYKSKSNGRNQFTFYSANFQDNVTESFELANDLKDAIGTDQLYLTYQPQVDLFSGKIVGVEALLRWQHPQKGLISPEKFIRIAEEYGYILELGTWVINKACEDRKKWLSEGLVQFRTAINISIKQFEQTDFVEQIFSILKTHHLNPKYIELEITEGVAMDEPAMVIDKLKQLKAGGLYISIDDFGMGYSSLNYLKNLPINQLKIDRSFIRDIIDEKNDLAIVQSIMAMAKSLNLEVVAEGVETIEQVNVLRSLSCNIAQGYYYFKPMVEEDVVKAIKQVTNVKRLPI